MGLLPRTSARRRLFVGIGPLAAFAAFGAHYKELSLTLEIERTKHAAANAALQVEALQKDNLVLEKNIEEERSRRLMIEAQLAPRTLSPSEESELTGTLRNFAGHSLRVSMQADPEAKRYGESIIRALRKAGWMITLQPGSGTLVLPRYGLYVGGPNVSSPALRGLVAALVKFGNPVCCEQMGDSSDYMEINLKPIFGLSPRMMMADRNPGLWRLPPKWTLNDY